jgi:hypothetical protein
MPLTGRHCSRRSRGRTPREFPAGESAGPTMQSIADSGSGKEHPAGIRNTQGLGGVARRGKEMEKTGRCCVSSSSPCTGNRLVDRSPRTIGPEPGQEFLLLTGSRMRKPAGPARSRNPERVAYDRVVAKVYGRRDEDRAGKWCHTVLDVPIVPAAVPRERLREDGPTAGAAGFSRRVRGLHCRAGLRQNAH